MGSRREPRNLEPHREALYQPIMYPNHYRLRHLVEEAGISIRRVFPWFLWQGLLDHILLCSFARGSRLYSGVVDMRSPLVTEQSG